jgi:hypothetical protein
MPSAPSVQLGATVAVRPVQPALQGSPAPMVRTARPDPLAQAAAMDSMGPRGLLALLDRLVPMEPPDSPAHRAPLAKLAPRVRRARPVLKVNPGLWDLKAPLD